MHRNSCSGSSTWSGRWRSCIDALVEEDFWYEPALARHRCGRSARIRELANAWRTLLTGLDDGDLTRPVPYPWNPPKTLAHNVSWVNVD